MKRFTATFAAAVIVACASAQQRTHTQCLYWVRYQNQIVFSPTLYWNNEADNRRFINPDVQNQLIFHSRLHYRKKNWDLAGGLTYSLAYAALPKKGYEKSVSEIRPVAELTHEWPIGKVFVQNRLRFDNRFFQNDPDKSVLEGSNYVMRCRYRLQARIPLRKDEANGTTISLRVADEIMFNTKQNTYDQNRIYISAEFLLSKNFSFEAGYLFIHQQRFGLDEFFSRHVLRFSLLHKIFIPQG